jgi:hypothetical protein
MGYYTFGDTSNYVERAGSIENGGLRIEVGEMSSVAADTNTYVCTHLERVFAGFITEDTSNPKSIGYVNSGDIVADRASFTLSDSTMASFGHYFLIGV